MTESYEARLERLRSAAHRVKGTWKGEGADSYELEGLVGSGEITLTDVEWLIENANERDIASGPIDWHVRPTGRNQIIVEMRSRVKPTTFLAMYVDRDGWGEIKHAGDRQLTIAESLSVTHDD